VKSVAIYGINHISEVLFIVLKELGLELTCVVEEEKAGEEWFGYNVIGMKEFVENKDSVLIFASFDKSEIDCFCKEYEDVKVVVLRE